jgi:hypothetical protein
MGLSDYTVGDKKLWQAGRDFERERIIKLIQDTYADEAYNELGSLEWTCDIVELIQAEVSTK